MLKILQFRCAETIGTNMPRKKKPTPPKVLSDRFSGGSTKIVPFDTEEKMSMLLYGGDKSSLAIAWDIDDAGHGFWRILPVGVNDNDIITKESDKSGTGVAFYGEVSIVGIGGTDLFTSYGHEDDDILDAEGHIVNKVKDVRVYPTAQK